MTKRTVAAVLAALALLVSGCAGETPKAQEKAAPPPPVPSLTEDAAQWAGTQLDPCKLMPVKALTAFRLDPPYMASPHHCVAELTTQSGDFGMINVVVGTKFTHVARATAEPIALDGLIAYQEVHTFEGTSSCEVNLPISPTISIEVHAPSSGPTTAGCTMARAAGTDVATALKTPGALVRAPGKTLAHWDLCVLTERALGKAVAPREASMLVMDKCSTSGAKSDAITVSTSTGPDQVVQAREYPEQLENATVVQLSALPALQATADGLCHVVWAQESAPVFRPNHMFLTATTSATTCPAAVDAANKVRSALLDAPPAAPPVPPLLGYPEGSRDEPGDATSRRGPEELPCSAPGGHPIGPGRQSGGEHRTGLPGRGLRAARRRDSRDDRCRTGHDGARRGVLRRPQGHVHTFRLNVKPSEVGKIVCAGDPGGKLITIADKPAVLCIATDTERKFAVGLRGTPPAYGVLTVELGLRSPRGVLAGSSRTGWRTPSGPRPQTSSPHIWSPSTSGSH